MYFKRDYGLTEEQKDLQAMVHEFAEKEIKPRAAEWDVNGSFSDDVLEMAKEMGLHLMAVPEKFGGMGLDKVTECILREEIGWADAGFSVTLGGFALGFLPVMLAGTDQQIAKFADVITAGGAAAFALTEAQGGSDAANTKTTAKKVGNTYVLNGSKAFISNGDIADVYTVFAMTDKSKGVKGISAFMVDRNTPGFSIGTHENKMGIRSSHTCSLYFDEMAIPEENLIGKEGEGFKIAMNTLNRTRVSGASGCVGIMQRAVEEAVAYSKEREVFGKTICKHQGIAFMLADMEIKTQAARQMVRYAARTFDADIIDPMVGSCSKTFVSDNAVQVCLDAIQVLGGYGYSREYPVEKLLRDAKSYQITEGTNQIQRVTISGNMLK